MQLSDFDYDLPEHLIAQYPETQRSASRLLHLSGSLLTDRHVVDLPGLLHKTDLLVFNNTKVMPARLYGRKASGGKVEILIERLLSDHRALAQIRASKSPKPGSRIEVDGNQLVVQQQQTLFELESLGTDFKSLMAQHGHMPLPPYLGRQNEPSDQSRYQTVYAQRDGAVAAPTAGLHFDDTLLTRLRQKGIEFAEVTLHIGAGTFQPVRTEDLTQHQMHQEWLEVTDSVCEKIRQTKSQGGRIVAVGTTCVRSLETAARSGKLMPYTGDTNLFIRPGSRFQVVDVLMTNFHLPRSTLLMLVAAFAGYENIMQAYQYAIQQEYRFFSYGDAMLLERPALQIDRTMS